MERPSSPLEARPALICCPACHQDAPLKRAPVYDGFKRVGETLSCASCGHRFSDAAAVPFKSRTAVPGFTPDDVPPPPKVFGDDDVRATTGRLCRHCAQYVVNPFLQRCGLTRRLVEATDTCPRFQPKPPPGAAP